MTSIEKLLEVMRRLREPVGGCPWDAEQTYSSIVPYTLEEAYEVAEAIAAEDLGALKDELGDLLFQVVFLSRIAEEEGAFAFDDVVDAIRDKLVRRHPHVFAAGPEDAAAGAAEVQQTWEQIKASERAAETADASALAGIPLALPALKRASKLGKRAASVGFDWPDSAGVRAKLDEELAELDRALESGSADAVSEELGDVLFSAANLARHLGVDAEQALAAASRKFAERFRGMEAQAERDGVALADLNLDALEALWRAQKG